MKVGLIIERFSRDGGGLERWTWQLAHALDVRGHQVSVLTFRQHDVPERATISVVPLPWDDDRMRRALLAERMVAGMRLDVTHDFGVCTQADILHPQSGSLLANERRDWHARRPWERMLARLNPRRAHWLHQVKTFEAARYPPRRAGLVIAVSRGVADDLAAWHRVPAECVRLVPNGVDTRHFTPAAPAVREALRERLGFAGQTVLLFAARNPRLKGVHPLLSAFARVRTLRPDMTLVTIGQHPNGRMLSDVRRLGMQHAVRCDGAVADPRVYLQAADAFVLPSWHDACSLSVLEACACGLPVMTTRTNGVSELLTHDDEGYIIESAADIPAIGKALMDLALPENRARLGRRARQTAEVYDVTRNVDQIERVYREVAARRLRDPEGSRPA